MFDITTGTGDFIAEGVISHNCFARPTHRYLDLNRQDFEREIVVKVNLPEVLRAELRRPSWKGEHVALGTNTDPYQWVEGRYRITRAVWEQMLEARNPCSVLTKCRCCCEISTCSTTRREGEVRGEPVDPDARPEGLARDGAGDRRARANGSRPSLPCARLGSRPGCWSRL